MHIIVLPSKWTKDTADYRERKEQIYSKIKNENTAEVVVKVSMLSKITAVMESLNSNTFVSLGSERLLWYGEYKEFRNLNEEVLELIRLLIKNSSLNDMRNQCALDVQSAINALEEVHLKSTELVLDMVPAQLAIELAKNADPFSNISPEINYHFILEEDREKIMDEIQFYKEEKNKTIDEKIADMHESIFTPGGI